MNGSIQQQQNVTQHIVGVTRDVRKVTTRTDKPMAGFTIDTLPEKWCDCAVDTAAHWAETREKVFITGQFCSDRGQIELVAQNISLAPPGQTNAQTGVSQGGYPMDADAVVRQMLEAGRIKIAGHVKDRYKRMAARFQINKKGRKTS